jgi:hypothetical protein
MQWHDVRFQLPGPDDDVIWKKDDKDTCVAWMLVSELPKFDRVPDPPQGWRFVENDDNWSPKAMWWDQRLADWRITEAAYGHFIKDLVYILPTHTNLPEGYRLKTDDDVWNVDALWWDKETLDWQKTRNYKIKAYSDKLVYAVPITSDEPELTTKPESFSDIVDRHTKELSEFIDSDDLNDGERFAINFMLSSLKHVQKLFSNIRPK